MEIKKEMLVYKLDKRYYISFDGGLIDNHNAKILNMEFKKYQEFLLNLNGYIYNHEIYFHTKKDAENAIDYIYSILIMNTL